MDQNKRREKTPINDKYLKKDQNAYLPVLCSFVDSRIRAASSVRFKSITFNKKKNTSH